MPIYEYACGACGHRFEEWQKMSDKPVRTCPKCKAKKVEKLISQTSFTLKGGGWYSDLYAGPKPGAKDSKSESGDSSSSEPSGGAKDAATKDSGTKETNVTKKADAVSTSSTKKSSDKAIGKKSSGAA